jgi:hypothetical protein
MSSWRNGYDNRRAFAELREAFLQLTELLSAMRSPSTAIEDHDSLAISQVLGDAEMAALR